MKTEDLIALGISQEVADKIFAMHGAELNKHKSAVDASKTEVDGFKKQLEDANKAIEGFKKLDVDGIKKAADEWKTKYEQVQQESAKALQTIKYDHALDGALAAAKVKNSKAIKALLNADALKFNEADGSIVGLDDQLKKVKESDSYLFLDDNPPPKIVTGGNPRPITGNAFTDAARRGAKLPVGENK